MQGIKFGNYHSYDDFGMILSRKDIKPPQPKVHTVDILGGDGVLDLTDYFGRTTFQNRILTFEFTTKIRNQEEYLYLFSKVQNAIHGQRLKVVLDDDSLYYYTGRVTVNEWKSDKTLGSIVIEVDAEPWKMSIQETMVMNTIDGRTDVILNNSRKRVVPRIITNAEMTFEFGEYSVTVGAGTFTIPEMELIEGENIITVEGTGTATFYYREGGL